MLGFFNAPYIALVFRPFALLPLQWAFLAWTMLSTCLYLVGIWLVCPKSDDLSRSTVFLAGIAFYPFVMESILGGQISTIAFFLFALATRLLEAAGTGWDGSGWMPVQTYFADFCPSGDASRTQVANAVRICGRHGALAGLSLVFVGRGTVREYIDVLLFYAQISSQPKDAFRVWMRLVDGVHFLSNS